MRAVPGRFPGNADNHSGIFPDSPIKLSWTDSGGGFAGSCGAERKGGMRQLRLGDSGTRPLGQECPN